jgi:hypothetical protein
MARTFVVPVLASTVLAVVVPAAAPAHAAVSGAVGGVRDPASGVLELWVQASESGDAGLRTARAMLAGQLLDTAHFDDPACAAGSAVECPAAGGVGLRVPTTAVPDGERRLEVAIVDGNGVAVHVLDRTITVANTPIPWTSTVTIGIGSSGTTSPSPAPGDGGSGGGPGPGGGAIGCRSPRLSVSLAQRPLRWRRGTPVLLAGRNYRFRGRLTCVIDARRRAAPRGTRVELRHVRRGRTIARRNVPVGANGRIRARLMFRSSRSLVFRVRAADGKRVQVRIPIRVVSRRQA